MLRTLLHLLGGKQVAKRHQGAFRPRCEALESREMLSATRIIELPDLEWDSTGWSEIPTDIPLSVYQSLSPRETVLGYSATLTANAYSNSHINIPVWVDGVNRTYTANISAGESLTTTLAFMASAEQLESTLFGGLVIEDGDFTHQSSGPFGLYPGSGQASLTNRMITIYEFDDADIKLTDITFASSPLFPTLYNVSVSYELQGRLFIIDPQVKYVGDPSPRLSSSLQIRLFEANAPTLAEATQSRLIAFNAPPPAISLDPTAPRTGVVSQSHWQINTDSTVNGYLPYVIASIDHVRSVTGIQYGIRRTFSLPQGVYLESDETNNVIYAHKPTIRSLPDLQLDTLEYTRDQSPDEFRDGVTDLTPLPVNKAFQLTAGVSNIGTGASNAFVVSFYASKDSNIDPDKDLLIASVPLSGLNAGSITVASFRAENGIADIFAAAGITFNTWYGETFFGAVVDPANQMEEISKANNSNEGANVESPRVELFDYLPEPRPRQYFASQRDAITWLRVNGFRLTQANLFGYGDVGYYRNLPTTITIVSPYDGKPRPGTAYREHVNILPPTYDGSATGNLWSIRGAKATPFGEPDPWYALRTSRDPEWISYVRTWHNRF